MLSDEEKKAISILKQRDSDFDELYTTYRQSFIKPYDKSIGIILELIEKQSKEIEKFKKPKYILKAETGEISQIPIDNNLYKELVDKIKAKIEEYDDKGMTVNLANRSAGKTFQQAVHYEVKKVLESLLEGE